MNDSEDKLKKKTYRRNLNLEILIPFGTHEKLPKSCKCHDFSSSKFAFHQCGLQKNTTRVASSEKPSKIKEAQNKRRGCLVGGPLFVLVVRVALFDLAFCSSSGSEFGHLELQTAGRRLGQTFLEGLEPMKLLKGSISTSHQSKSHSAFIIANQHVLLFHY